jgi:hypothetical protein
MKKTSIFETIVIILLCAILVALCMFYRMNDKVEVKQTSFEEVTEKKVEEETVEQEIMSIGDNFTYVDSLKNLVNANITELGGKLTSKDIAARLGAYKVLVKSFTIPSDTSKVNITLINNNKTPCDLFQKSGLDINPVTIDNIEGNIEYKNNKYTFQRLESGTSVTVDNDTEVIVKSHEISSDTITILYMGRNDESNAYFTENLVTFYNNIINKYNLKNYIIIGIIDKDNYDSTSIKTVNKTLNQEFKTHFLDFRSELEKDNIEPVLNDETQLLLSESIQNKLIELNYINQ